MSLLEWQQVRKFSPNLIVNGSVQDGSDSWTSFPIGIAAASSHCINQYVDPVPSKTDLVACSFNVETDQRRRGSLPVNRKTIAKTLLANHIPNEMKDAKAFVEAMRRSWFVISPVGNGIDCHRHQEALLVGCIPIIEDHPLIRQKQKNLPVLFTSDYSEITPEYLKTQLESFQNGLYDFSRLFLSAQPNFRSVIVANGNYWCKFHKKPQFYLTHKLKTAKDIPRATVTSKNVFIDVGTNLMQGFREIGPKIGISDSWTVCFVEPNPECHAAIQTEIGSRTNWKLYPCAVDYFNGEATFVRPTENSTDIAGSICGEEWLVKLRNKFSMKTPNITSVTVSTRTLQSIMDEQPGATFWIKLDCEGKEYDILEFSDVHASTIEGLIVEFHNVLPQDPERKKVVVQKCLENGIQLQEWY